MTSTPRPRRLAPTPKARATPCASLVLAASLLGCDARDPSVATAPGAAVTHDATPAGPGGRLVLRGTVVTPDGVIEHGYVAVADGRIVAVSDRRPPLDGARTVDTEGILVPGFVDVHNHIPWHVLPQWSPGRTFTNREQWWAEPEYLRLVEGPFDRLAGTHLCDMNAWGELRALVGGTTSSMTTRSAPCIRGLVRNLDYHSGFYGTTELDREHVFNVLALPPAGDPAARAAFVGAARFFIANPFYEALVMHLAEGTDAAAAEEFAFVRTQALLNPKGVIVHGIPLGPDDFRAMAAAGTALVWSPRSNLALYGTTADVGAALDAGVEVALAPDWAVTGSGTMLDELAVAARWNRDHLGGRLTDRQLVAMVTSVPARLAGVDDEVGAIRVGLRADLLVIGGGHLGGDEGDDPHRAVVAATTEDVALVLVGGVPLYGDRTMMQRVWAPADLETVPGVGSRKALATPAAGVVLSTLAARLQAALRAEGTSLAPLIEPPRGAPRSAPR
jgi:5-methylthioadenosine/S-adenosylhomocysteine deaminase